MKAIVSYLHLDWLFDSLFAGSAAFALIWNV